MLPSYARSSIPAALAKLFLIMGPEKHSHQENLGKPSKKIKSVDFFYKGRVGPSPHFFVSFITIELPDILHTLGGMGGIKESVEKIHIFHFFQGFP